jgi:hypothetical protein
VPGRPSRAWQRIRALIVPHRQDRPPRAPSRSAQILNRPSRPVTRAFGRLARRWLSICIVGARYNPRATGVHNRYSVAGVCTPQWCGIWSQPLQQASYWGSAPRRLYQILIDLSCQFACEWRVKKRLRASAACDPVAPECDSGEGSSGAVPADCGSVSCASPSKGQVWRRQ